MCMICYIVVQAARKATKTAAQAADELQRMSNKIWTQDHVQSNPDLPARAGASRIHR